MFGFVTRVAVVVATMVLYEAGDSHATPCWAPPVEGVVTDPFRAPGCRWCPGNRGLEYDLTRTQPVRAVAAGTVQFDGAVAGVRYVVVESATGWLVTYGHLSASQLERGTLERGTIVVAGTILGEATDRFYFGLRIRGEYRDPAPFLADIVGRPRLVPVDARPARSVPGRRLVCPPVPDSVASRPVT